MFKSKRSSLNLFIIQFYSLERLDLLCNEDEWTKLKAYGNVNNYHSHSHM